MNMNGGWKKILKNSNESFRKSKNFVLLPHSRTIVFDMQIALQIWDSRTVGKITESALNVEPMFNQEKSVGI